MTRITTKALLASGLLLAVAMAAGLWTVTRHRPPPPAGPGAVAGTEATTAAENHCSDCNLLLISVDTLRADRLGVYGYERHNSPNLSLLAADGVLFERFYHNGGGTLPSHMTMLTSLRPLTHNVDVHTHQSLDPRWTTLAEQLQEAGVATAGFVDGGWVLGEFGFDRGFDTWDESGGEFETILPKAHQWVAKHRRERFFLFLHTYDIHSTSNGFPYHCPGKYMWQYTDPVESFDGCRDGRCASDLLAWTNAGIRSGTHRLIDVFSPPEVAAMSSAYDGCIGYVDARIADFLGTLRSLGLYDRTMIAITSDHGEEFGDHGMLIHDQAGYEEISHVPLILKLPFSTVSGRRVQGLAAMIDLMPTLLASLDVPIPEQAQGRSLLPAVFGDRQLRDHVHFYDNLVTDEWKFLRGSKELYRYRDDPEERENYYSARSEVARELSDILESAVVRDEEARLGPPLESRDPEAELSDEERERLRALGYLH